MLDVSSSLMKPVNDSLAKQFFDMHTFNVQGIQNRAVFLHHGFMLHKHKLLSRVAAVEFF